MASIETTPSLIALGFVEVRGLTAAIDTADAMLKCAEVRLVRQLQRDPAQITLVVEGNLGACVASVEAGKACAARHEALVAGHVIGRPAEDTGAFILSLFERGSTPFAPPQTYSTLTQTQTSGNNELSAESIDAVLLEIITHFAGTCGAQMLIARSGQDPRLVQQRLDALCAAGVLLRKRGRYFLPDQPKEGT